MTPAKKSNKLTSTTVAGVTELYGHAGAEELAGSMTSTSHLSSTKWDQLAATAAQAMAGGTPETTCYVYDGTGRRVRKVTERQMHRCLSSSPSPASWQAR